MSVCAQCQSEIATGLRVCSVCRALQPVSDAHPRFGPGVTVERKYGRIVVDGLVGEGGMGIVLHGWLFYPPTDPRSSPVRLALKVLRPDSPLKVELRHFLEREANLLLRLDHPNIVQRLDVFEWPADPAAIGAAGIARVTSGAAGSGPVGPPTRAEDRSLVLAMEFVDSDTLADVIARHVARARLAGPPTLPGMAFLRAWAYFQQLLGALASTHAIGIVHLDVKPSNVLVRRDGLVKLTDFGIARSTMTPSSSLVSTLAPGTGAYMSPEQVMGHEVDARSDLYSAAIVLFEMLCGRTPFLSEGRGELAVRQDQVFAAPPSIRAFLPQAPPIVEALFMRALSKSPTDRFASAIEMGDAFRDALSVSDTPEWRAQAEMARLAAEGMDQKTRKQRMGTLKDFLVKKYQTEKLPQRD